ncbi:coiled-coil domain-containing protein 180-like isoform X2 [Styela clava]
MSEVRVPVRVLPSGKVYRQMFDAEVQLVKSLQARKPEKHRLPPLQLSTETAQHSRDLKSSGNILTERQRSWMIGMPNDYATENPVKYRQTTTEAASRLQENEPDAEIVEVRGLPNVLSKTKRESNIIDKIAERRKERHEIEVEKMHDDLCMISNRIEPRITEIGQFLIKQFAEDDEKIKAIFKEIESDEELVNFSHEMLEQIWNRVEEHSPKRKTWVELADANFALVEHDRIEVISGVFRKYAAVLEKIASLMPADVQRFIEKESMMANQSILANRRAYAKLRINLLESDIQREMVQHLTWSERVQDWKKLNAEIAVKQFIEFMNGNDVTNPPDIDGVNESHLQEQTQLQEKRNETLEQLLEFKPPTSTKTSVYKWNSALSKSQENIDQLHLKWVRTLNEKYENVCQRCLAEIDKYRQNLLLSKVCSEEDVQRIVNEHMLPLVGQRQREFESRLEKMDQIFESLAIRTEHQLKRLFKFTQGAAHLWDVHEIGLAKQERKLQNDLDESRQKHDVDNQERESKLDVVMDRLRQESTEEALTSFLQKSLEMLEHIYSGYEEFHEEQINTVTKYPDMVKSEIQRYDDAVCTFFNVNRNKPTQNPNTQPKSPKKRNVAVVRGQHTRRLSMVRPVSAQESSTERRLSIQHIPERRTHSAEHDKRPRSPSPLAKQTSPRPIQEKAKVLRDTLTTDKGTSFYVVTVADKEDFEEEGEKEDTKDDDNEEGRRSSALSGTAFMTEVSDESGKSEMPMYIRTVYMETATLRNIKKCIRMQFLNHLETWSEQAMINADNSARDKQEELASELDLRKHLHEPRAKRIELDVHNVRAAELVLHKERVSRHCKGITAALLGLKQDFDEMTKDHEIQASNFRTKIEAMENIFINATKSAKLVELTNSLHGNLDSYMQAIKASLRHFRQTLDNTLSRLRDSNAQCLKSFKLFSQGGNFSPDETVGLRKKLEKMSQRVDAAEGVIMHDLEGMESKRLDQATEVITKFEDRFRNHMSDLTFIEKVQRWITNSQVRIKTEVAHSNGMAASVTRHVKLVKSRIDACKHPNPDKEDITPKFLCQYTNEVMSCLHTRADYLNCKVKIVEESPLQSSAQDLTDRTAVEKPASRGGGLTPAPSSRQKSRQSQGRNSKAGSNKPTPPGVSAPSRTDLQTGGTSRRAQHQEDSAIGMIKSILRAQKGMDPESEDLRSVMTGGTRPIPSTAASQIGNSRMQKGSFKRQGTLTSIAGSTTDSDKGKKKDGGSRVGSGIYKRRETKFELRHMVFGTSSTSGTHFEAKITQILYETLDGLLSTGEIYYKQKGARAVTRPDHMQDNFDQFSDVVVAKLLNYEEQTKEYHNTSLQEFRHQLKTLEEDLSEVPNLVLDEILRKSLQNLRREQQIIQAEFLIKEANWKKVKENHKVSLRPTLGHPDQEVRLQQLITKEEERQAENLSGIQQHSKDLNEKAHEVTKHFLLNIGQACASLLDQFDYSLTIDDVNSGKIELKKEPTSILLRKKAAGIDLHDTSYRPSLPRGPNVWPGLEVSHLLEKGEVLTEVAEDINCNKTTLSHTSSVTTRDKCLTAFTEAYNSVMGEIKEQEELRTLSEERWAENWRQSVRNVQQLYT